MDTEKILNMQKLQKTQNTHKKMRGSLRGFQLILSSLTFWAQGFLPKLALNTALNYASIQQTPREDTHLSSNDKASWELMILPHFPQNLEGLIRQLPGRRYYQNPQAISWSPLLAIEELQSLKALPCYHHKKLRRKTCNKLVTKSVIKKKNNKTKPH